jgi:rhamnosyltransferase
MKRLCVFTHYDKDSIIDDHVVEYLKGLKAVMEKLIFVSVCKLNTAEQSKISSVADKILLRKNEGYDFMSWQHGLRNEGYENLKKYDEVILANDSCYAPMFPLNEMFEKMSKKKCDFWGICDSHSYSYHLQSYFLVFRKNILSSKDFETFWESIEPLQNKTDVVQKYEIGCSRFFINKGYRLSAYMHFPKFKLFFYSFLFKYQGSKKYLYNFFRKEKKLSNYYKKNKQFYNKRLKLSHGLKLLIKPFIADLSLDEWHKLLEKRCPIVKVILLRDNPRKSKKVKRWEEYLKKYTDYDTDLIKKHLDRIGVIQ